MQSQKQYNSWESHKNWELLVFPVSLTWAATTFYALLANLLRGMCTVINMVEIMAVFTQALSQTGLLAAQCLSPESVMKMTEETSRVILLSRLCKVLPMLCEWNEAAQQTTSPRSLKKKQQKNNKQWLKDTKAWPDVAVHMNQQLICRRPRVYHLRRDTSSSWLSNINRSGLKMKGGRKHNGTPRPDFCDS